MRVIRKQAARIPQEEMDAVIANDPRVSFSAPFEGRGYELTYHVDYGGMSLGNVVYQTYDMLAMEEIEPSYWVIPGVRDAGQDSFETLQEAVNYLMEVRFTHKTKKEPPKSTVLPSHWGKKMKRGKKMKKMRVIADEKNYTIFLAEDPQTFEWRATIDIPEAHVHEEGSGNYGWEALANLADRMKRMGLLD